MRRTYADLHLCADTNDVSQFTRLVNKASALGYGLVATPFPTRTNEQQVKRIREICKEVGLDFAARVDLVPRTAEELLKELRKVRRGFELVAVMCYSKAVARQAAKDRRVDLLNFPQPDFRKTFFDAAEAELASNCMASFEVDLKPLLVLEKTPRIRLLSMLKREVETAIDFHVPIVASSGVSEELLMRKPLELACLGSLVGLCASVGIDAVSRNSAALVTRNREKLDWSFVAPGIRVIRRGKDC